MATGAKPDFNTPMSLAAPVERSITRPLAWGPRSLIRTTTERPFRRLVTRTFVPKGRVRWAAVNCPGLKVSPLAVRRPEKPLPYQEAIPCLRLFLGCALCRLGATAVFWEVERVELTELLLELLGFRLELICGLE
jgi:hypothetical protein